MIFGNPKKNLKSYAAILSKQIYSNSILNSIEMCFYSFYALDLSYPPESFYIWTFIQNYIFEIFNDKGGNIAIVKSVNNDLLNLN